MWKFLSRWGKPDPFVYLLTLMTIWLTAPEMAKADTIQNKTTIDGEVIFGVNSYGGVIPTVTRSGSNRCLGSKCTESAAKDCAI